MQDLNANHCADLIQSMFFENLSFLFARNSQADHTLQLPPFRPTW
jgi:hypothetical protein